MHQIKSNLCQTQGEYYAIINHDRSYLTPPSNFIVITKLRKQLEYMKYITNYIKTKGKYKTNWYKPRGERRNGTKWQIFKWGVFLHVAMALIAEKGLNPSIIDLLNQNTQKRNRI